MYYISHTVHMFLARHTGIKCTISFLEIQCINIQKHQHFPLDCAVIQYPFFPCSSWNYINTWRIQPKDHLNNRKWCVFPGSSNRSTNRKSKQLNKFSVRRPLRHPSSSTPYTSMDNWIALRNIWIHSHILRTRFNSMHTTCIGQMQRYQPAGSSPLLFSLVDLFEHRIDYITSLDFLFLHAGILYLVGFLKNSEKELLLDFFFFSFFPSGSGLVQITFLFSDLSENLRQITGFFFSISSQM